MKIFVHEHIRVSTLDWSTSATSPIPQVDLPYDETAPGRMYDAISALERYNVQPTALLCGVRAFLSIHAYSAQRGCSDGQSPDPDHQRFMSWGTGGRAEVIEVFGHPVMLDVDAHEDSIRAATGINGLGLALKRRQT